MKIIVNGFYTFLFSYKCKCILLQSLLLCCFISCQKDKNEAPLHITKCTDQQSIYAYIRDYHYLSLSTPLGIQVGEVNKIGWLADTMVILDKLTTAIHLFSNHGEWIHTIQLLGEGPGEFSRLLDIAINSDAMQIIAYDYAGSKLMYFSSTGVLLKEQRLPFAFLEFEYVAPNRFIFYTGSLINSAIPAIFQKQQLITTDSAFQILDAFFSVRPADFFSANDANVLFRQGDDILFAKKLDNIIYRFDGKTWVKHHELNLPGKSIPVDELKINSFEDFNALLKKNDYTAFYGSFIDNQDFALFTFYDANGPYFAIYDKKKQQGFCYNRVEADLNNQDAFMLVDYPIAVYQNKFVAALDSDYIYHTIQALKHQPQALELTIPEVFTSATLSSNPILVFFTLANPE
ncbi:MAG TPA: 6-bladed beta-propeller [Saprospiraceae bacterium]|nr:6-bladed beta-propeller [Saprospiraceae bacterium]HMP25008.1 6-bladed beta-propeller [Saprospiraceae bacterium]